VSAATDTIISSGFNELREALEMLLVPANTAAAAQQQPIESFS
jgi:hypothetical protein